jgi:DNA phosphorothioation-associated putative methyltransferase
VSHERRQLDPTTHGAPRPAVLRHKAAIRRNEPSLPVKCLMRDRLLRAGGSLFDYGCGYGEDVQHLKALGIDADGWDPAHCPRTQKRLADVINLGFILNVIEDSDERGETLRDAWSLCRQVMAVASRIKVGGRGKTEIELGDGVVTRIGTFQKYFTQAELRQYIETQLQTEAVAAAPGVFYVFRDESLGQQFAAARYRRRAATPVQRLSEVRFERHRDLLEPLMAWITDRGRIPEPDEFPGSDQLIADLGSIRRATALIYKVTGLTEWEGIRRRRTEDLLIYLALANFRRRPPFAALPLSIQRDIRAFFGTYRRACDQADALLFQAGSADAVDEACKQSPLGKLLPNALYVHASALPNLSPLLRVYEGCAKAYLGGIEGANIIKLHRFSGKVSYLCYPDFDTDPHPPLLRSIKLSMRSRELDCFDYASSENPPVLHRKETFLLPEHPDFDKFARLSRQEDKHGLLADSSGIGNREQWHARLNEHGFYLRGHRLCRHKK